MAEHIGDENADMAVKVCFSEQNKSNCGLENKNEIKHHPEIEMEMKKVPRRVKLYQLDDHGEWDDRGTGHVFYFRTHAQTGKVLQWEQFIQQQQQQQQQEEATEANETIEMNNGRFALPDSLLLYVRSETDPDDELLYQSIDRGTEYQRQGQTIIAWCDMMTGIDLALSFQDPEQCGEVWEEIVAAQHRIAATNGKNDANIDKHNDLFILSENVQNFKLPDPEIANLNEFARRVQSGVVSGHKGHVAQQLQANDKAFIRKLWSIFREAEDHNDDEICKQLFAIFKQIFLLADATLIDWITRSHHVLDTVGCLEYDPNIPADEYNYHQHRDYLRASKLKLVIEFHDRATLRKIQQNHHLQYIRDVVLVHHLDETAMSSLTNIIFFNTASIVDKLCENKNFFSDLFETMQLYAGRGDLRPTDREDSPFKKILCNSGDNVTQNEPEYIEHAETYLSDSDTSTYMSDEADRTSPMVPRKRKFRHSQDKYLERSLPVGSLDRVLLSSSPYNIRRNLFLFLKELVFLAKNLQVRDALMRVLYSKGFLKLLDIALNASDPADLDQLPVWMSCVDVVSNMITHDAEMFRSFVEQNALTSKTDTMHSCSNLMPRLFEAIVQDYVDSGLVQQIVYAVRAVIDTESMSAADKRSFETSRFLSELHNRQLQKLVTLVQQSPSQLAKLHTLGYSKYPALYHVLELLTLCAQQHSANFRRFAFRLNLLSDVVGLIDIPRMEIKCSIVRFVRAVIGTQDASLRQKIVSSRLLDPIIDAFVANGSRYNLLNSVVLDMLVLIHKENIHDIVEYLVVSHIDRLRHVSYVKIIDDLQLRYEQNVEAMSKGSMTETRRIECDLTLDSLSNMDEDDDLSFQPHNSTDLRAEESRFDEAILALQKKRNDNDVDSDLINLAGKPGNSHYSTTSNNGTPSIESTSMSAQLPVEHKRSSSTGAISFSLNLSKFSSMKSNTSQCSDSLSVDRSPMSLQNQQNHQQHSRTCKNQPSAESPINSSSCSSDSISADISPKSLQHQNNHRQHSPSCNTQSPTESLPQLSSISKISPSLRPSSPDIFIKSNSPGRTQPHLLAVITNRNSNSNDRSSPDSSGQRKRSSFGNESLDLDDVKRRRSLPEGIDDEENSYSMAKSPTINDTDSPGRQQVDSVHH